MAVISINYSEGSRKKDLGYKSVDVSFGKGLNETKVFQSGYFIKDWYDCWKFIITEMPGDEHVANSSSVNHFFMDGGSKMFDTAYLNCDDKYAELFYTQEPTRKIKFFVPKNTQPTWLELRKLCGDLNELQPEQF